jgi:hypothetical protein
MLLSQRLKGMSISHTRGLSGYWARWWVADSRGPVLVAGLSLNKYETVDQLPNPKALCVPNGASGKQGGIPEYVALHWYRELCQCGPFISPALVGSKRT